MPSFGPSPREQPLSYPGAAPEASGLMTGGTFLPFERLRRRRLAQARVILGEERPAALEPAGSRVTLGYALLILNAVPIEARVPVLAVGSNASLAQMHLKFQAAGISSVMPLTWAEVTGVRVGVAAMISRWGYVPAAPVFEPDVTARLAINWLDPDQLEALDETEVGYERRLLADGDEGARVCLESGERLSGCGIYVSRPGVLDEPGGGHPMAMPATQRELLDALLSRSRSLRRLARDADGFVTAAADPGRREQLARLLVESPDIGVVPWAGPTREGDPETYGASRAGLPPPEDVPAGAGPAVRVAPSPDEIDRRGEPTVVVTDAAWEAMGRPTHVVVHSCMHPPTAPAVGHVIAGDTGDEVQVDQAIRNGLGIEIGEYVTLAATGVTHHHLADLTLSTPNSLLCRVQQAELVTTERRAALLSRLALELVGVESGDRVVIEGLPVGPGAVLRTVTVRAFEAPDDTIQRRERVSGGGFQHRFPAARDALGVHPDLPWIFIDRTLRSQLGVADLHLAVVRVRASRKDQLTKELREMLLVVVLAFVGLLQVVHGAWLAAALVAATVVVFGIVGMRLRARLREL
jgi:hypothetical protein